MIVWAEDNKYKTNPGNPGTDYIIPPRTENKIVMSEWKDDLKFVTKLDRLLSDGKTLTKKTKGQWSGYKKWTTDEGYTFMAKNKEDALEYLKHMEHADLGSLKEVVE